MPDPNYFALLEACAQPGCPVCRLVDEAVRRYLDSLLYERVNDGGTRRQLRHSLGFCAIHAHLLLEMPLRDPLGLTIIYHDLLGYVLDKLPEANVQTGEITPLERLLRRLPKGLAGQVKRTLQALSPQDQCPACQQQEKYSQMLIQSLLENWHVEMLEQAYETSSGLCLPHLRLALEYIRSPDQFTTLMDTSLRKLQALRAELSEFIRKSDYRFSKEGFGEEGNAYWRAMGFFVGKK